VRVSSDSDETNNGLFYIYSDHLGSASVMSHSNGSKVAGSDGRFLPFGAYRGAPPATNPSLTDIGFTGHKRNDDLGLIYMNARYYLPYINRFLSPDTIVPNPANPQSFNRYSYVRNNPLGFKDPTGHFECYANGICADVITSTWVPTRPFSPFLNFTGRGWTLQEKQMAHRAAGDIASRMAETVNSARSEMIGGDRSGAYASASPVSPQTAFLGFFDGPITMHRYTDRGCTVATDCRAWASETEKTIYVGRAGFTNHQLMIHEVFHTIDLVILGGAANRALWDVQRAPGSTFPNRPNLTGDSPERWGFAGGNFSDWQKSRSGASGEEFSDMGIGWTYNQWERSDTGVGWSPAGQARANFMNVNMAIWLNERIP
jgi:RHS repeat-associated protein